MNTALEIAQAKLREEMERLSRRDDKQLAANAGAIAAVNRELEEQVRRQSRQIGSLYDRIAALEGQIEVLRKECK